LVRLSARLSRLTTERWLGRSLLPLMSVPAFEYRAREGVCNAVLQCLGGTAGYGIAQERFVNEEGPLLIADEPEEDLDNRVMLAQRPLTAGRYGPRRVTCDRSLSGTDAGLPNCPLLPGDRLGR
jgi:hypothetical protein